MLAPRHLTLPLLLTVAALGPGAVPGAAQLRRFESLHRMLPLDQTLTMAVVLADLDGDGDIDLVTGNRPWWSLPSPLDERGRLYLNDGAARFTEAQGFLPETRDWTNAIACADVDGDGDLDLVVANERDDELWLNDGSARFTAVDAPAFASHSVTWDVTLGDVDGDGDRDLLLGKLDDTELWLNDGNGGFSLASGKLPKGSHDVRALGLCDVDADGDLDALALGVHGTELWINDGLGAFGDGTSQLPASPFASNDADLAFADVDSDGDQDVLLLGCGSPLCLWVNDGHGVFTDGSAQRLPAGPAGYQFTYSIAAGDVDGDADVDFVVGGDHSSVLFLNDGQGRFRSSPLPQPHYWVETRAVALGDLDGDGNDDLVRGNASNWDFQDVQNRLLLGRASGELVDVSGPRLRVVDVEALAAGDIDGDGSEDLLVASRWDESGPVVLLLNDGTGGLRRAQGILPPYSEPATVLATGDVDGDGDQDLVVGGVETCKLMLNDGKGVLAEAPDLLPPTPRAQTRALALGDLDGDGDLDLLRATLLRCALWINDGAGHFEDASDHLPALPSFAFDLALADLDGDADLDVLVSAIPAGVEERQYGRLWLNDGQGIFSEAQQLLPPEPAYWNSPALGDVDADGDIDIVVRSDVIGSTAYWPEVVLLLNDGGAGFSHAPWDLPRTVDFPGVLALFDGDGDGDLDLAVAGVYHEPTRLLWNDGSGRFELLQETMPALPDVPVTTKALLPSDLDSDGDLDLLVGSAEMLQVHTNLARQLTWRSLPRVGRPLTLDLHGPGHATWLLSVSAAGPAASGPIAPARPWTVVAGGVLGPDGKGAWTVDVPADPALVRRTWLWRATIGGRSSNLEATTFLGP